MIDKDCLFPRKWLLDYVLQAVLPICKSHGVTVLWVKYCLSESQGLHIYIKITPAVYAVCALKLQLWLGDDCQRWSRCRARLRAGVNWNRLFEEENVKLHTLYRAGDQ